MSRLALTQNWLALDHEAIWIGGLVGARFGELEGAARDLVAAHEASRDRLAAAVRDLGGAPVATQPSYDVDDPRDPAAAKALVRDVEARIGATCVRLVALTQDDDRARATTGLRTAALTQIRWGGSPEPFPGLD